MPFVLATLWILAVVQHLAEWMEGKPVQPAGAQPVQGSPVLCRAVALMTSESVASVNLLLPHHPVVAGDFSNDGSRRDREGNGITVRQTTLRQMHFWQCEVVQEHEARPHGQTCEGLYHGYTRGRQYPHMVDVNCRDAAHSNGQCAGSNGRCKTLTGFRR